MEFIVINRSFGRDSKNLVNEINLKSFQALRLPCVLYYQWTKESLQINLDL